MRVRQLPAEEWGKLKGLPIAAKVMPDPHRSVVVVAEDEDKIVGTWGVVLVPVLEGLWVDEAYRKKSSAAGRMWQAMKRILMRWQLPQALTLVQTTDVLNLAIHAGFTPVAGTLCILDFPLDDK